MLAGIVRQAHDKIYLCLRIVLYFGLQIGRYGRHLHHLFLVAQCNLSTELPAAQSLPSP